MSKEMVHQGQRVIFTLLVSVLCTFMHGSTCDAQIPKTRTESFQSSHRSSSLVRTKLRISWGGPKPLRWQGSVSTESGTILSVDALGLTSDTPGTIQISERQVRIHQLSPVVYSGMDIEIEGNADAFLTIELEPMGQSATKFSTRLSVASLLSGDQAMTLGSRIG